jgi:uncharacterized protein (DUF1015 family)
MPEIEAFRGLRYDMGHVGSLSDVVAPPYDVINPALQEELYKKHPCNVVRLILNRIEREDDEANNRYIRAGKFLKSWREEGVLFEEADPAIYVYHQEFEALGQTFIRKGFMARIRLERFGEGKIFPHEQTLPKAKADRMMLTAVCKANLSQIFGLYPDETCEVQGALDAAVAEKTPLVAVDHLGVTHRMWPVTDVSVIAAVTGMMGRKPIFIADGHHRYETACNYKDQVYDSGFLSPDHPANCVLMHCVAMDDPGLAVLPTHRLLPGVPDLDATELAEKLGDLFTTRDAGEGPSAANEVWEDVETTDRQDTMALYTKKDGRWTILQLTEAGQAKMDEIAVDRDPVWRQLGVSILHRLVIETLVAPGKAIQPKYVHLVEEVMEGIESGEYPIAALVMPATVQHIRQISMAAERMPAKSTYFYPKLLSGLVINPLEP